MRAAVIHETGDPDVLRIEEIDQPQPGEGEVLIRLHAASVNPVDWKYRRGYMEQSLPNVLGREGSGVVEGSNDDRFAPGDEVFGQLTSGGYAEYATASADAITKKPDTLSHEQTAAITVAGLTAWQPMFDKAELDRGQTVLITGAAGGVGHFAVQFARVAGIRAIGTGSARNREFVLGLGADEYIDYTQQDVASEVSGVDLALDTVGGDVTASVVPTVREGGLIVTIASAPPQEAAAERGARAELHVMTANADELARVGELVASGEVKVELAEVLPLDEVARAHELSEGGHVRGKLVLKIA